LATRSAIRLAQGRTPEALSVAEEAPLAQERLERQPEGLVRITLKRAYNDATIAVDIDPLSLLGQGDDRHQEAAEPDRTGSLGRGASAR
jgi:hypothetical protein